MDKAVHEQSRVALSRCGGASFAQQDRCKAPPKGASPIRPDDVPHNIDPAHTLHYQRTDIGLLWRNFLHRWERGSRFQASQQTT